MEVLRPGHTYGSGLEGQGHWQADRRTNAGPPGPIWPTRSSLCTSRRRSAQNWQPPTSTVWAFFSQVTNSPGTGALKAVVRFLARFVDSTTYSFTGEKRH